MNNSNIPKLLKNKSHNFKYNSKHKSKRNIKNTFRKKNALKVSKHKSKKHKQFIGGNNKTNSDYKLDTKYNTNNPEKLGYKAQPQVDAIPATELVQEQLAAERAAEIAQEELDAKTQSELAQEELYTNRATELTPPPTSQATGPREPYIYPGETVVKGLTNKQRSRLVTDAEQTVSDIEKALRDAKIFLADLKAMPLTIEQRSGLVTNAEETVIDIEKALRDANKILSDLKAIPIQENKSELKPPSNIYPKQYTLGFILPANTEFAELPQKGISPESYFADIAGHTISRPLQLSSMKIETGKDVAVVSEPPPPPLTTTPRQYADKSNVSQLKISNPIGLTPFAQHSMTPVPRGLN